MEGLDRLREGTRAPPVLSGGHTGAHLVTCHQCICFVRLSARVLNFTVVLGLALQSRRVRQCFPLGQSSTEWPTDKQRGVTGLLNERLTISSLGRLFVPSTA